MRSLQHGARKREEAGTLVKVKLLDLKVPSADARRFSELLDMNGISFQFEPVPDDIDDPLNVGCRMMTIYIPENWLEDSELELCDVCEGECSSGHDESGSN